MADFGHFFQSPMTSSLSGVTGSHEKLPQLPVSPTLPFNFFLPTLPHLQNLHLARFHPYLASQMLLRQQAAAAAAVEAHRVTSQPIRKSMGRKRPSSVSVLDLSLPKSFDAARCEQRQPSSNCDVRRSSIASSTKSDADVTQLCSRVTRGEDESMTVGEEEGENVNRGSTSSCGSSSPPLTPTTPSMAFKKNMLKRFRKFVFSCLCLFL